MACNLGEGGVVLQANWVRGAHRFAWPATLWGLTSASDFCRGQGQPTCEGVGKPAKEALALIGQGQRPPKSCRPLLNVPLELFPSQELSIGSFCLFVCLFSPFLWNRNWTGSKALHLVWVGALQKQGFPQRMECPKRNFTYCERGNPFHMTEWCHYLTLCWVLHLLIFIINLISHSSRKPCALWENHHK